MPALRRFQRLKVYPLDRRYSRDETPLNRKHLVAANAHPSSREPLAEETQCTGEQSHPSTKYKALVRLLAGLYFHGIMPNNPKTD